MDQVSHEIRIYIRRIENLWRSRAEAQGAQGVGEEREEGGGRGKGRRGKGRRGKGGRGKGSRRKEGGSTAGERREALR